MVCISERDPMVIHNLYTDKNPMPLWETGTITVIEIMEEQRCKLMMPVNTFHYIMLSAGFDKDEQHAEQQSN